MAVLFQSIFSIIACEDEISVAVWQPSCCVSWQDLAVIQNENKIIIT